MAFVMAIGSEVFGSCVEGIFASVEIENRGAWLFCEWRYVSFIRGGKSAQNLRWRWLMAPGIGRRFGLFKGD